MRSNLVLSLLLFACISFVSCNSSSRSNGQPVDGSDQTNGTIRLQVQWPDTAAPASDRFSGVRSDASIDCGALNITHIGAAVYSETNELLTQGGPWECQTGSGSIDQVPAGDNYLVQLNAFNADADELFRGEAAEVSVHASQETTVNISMVPVFSRAVSLVEDVCPGGQSSFPHRLVATQDQLFFIAQGAGQGFELFTAPAAGTGAQLVQDIYQTDAALDRIGVMAPTDLVELNGWLYFRAYHASGYRLWRTDGTADHTEPIATGVNYFNPTELTVLGRQIFFAAFSNAAGRELWVFDETSGQVQQVGDIRPGAASSNPHELTAAGNRLYYVANDGQNGYEIWQVDPADGSTSLVSDLFAGYTGSCPRDLTAVGDRLFFIAKNGSQNPNAEPPTFAKEIWMAYETAGAIAVELTADLNPTTEDSGSSAPKNLTWVYGTTLAFSAFEPNFGQELYLFDWQSGEAPRRLTDLNPFAESSYPANFVHLNGTLYFTAYNSNNEEHVWAYSLAGDTISCLTTGLPHPYPRDLVAFQQILYFSAAYAAGGRKLWATDGTRTSLVLGADSAMAQQMPANLTAAANRLYYTAFNAELGEELYQLTNP